MSIEPLDDIPHHMTRDDLRDRPREDVEEAARKWFAIASEMKEIQDVLTEDLEKALNLLQEYQRFMAMLNSPDPNIPEVRRLFLKYKMKFTENTNANYGIYLDGKDITSNPEGLDNELADEPERVELIIDEEGKMRFIPARSGNVAIETSNVEWSDGEDIEPVEDADLEWLKEDNVYTDEEVHEMKEHYAFLATGHPPCCQKCGMYLNIHGEECVFEFQGGA
jgi:hypothetical protein